MNGPEVDYGIEIGQRILAIQFEHAAFDAEQKRNREETLDLVFRYCRWFQYEPKPIPKSVHDHLAEGVSGDWLAGKWF